MKTLELNWMENIEGGSNRQCLIDGVLITTFTALGAAGGLLGAIGGFFAGVSVANSDGCFDK